MRILVACEFSGRVRDAFNAKGHDAMSCDILPTESPGPHYTGDVMDILDDDWDMLIGFPPCTYMANSGARWLYEKPGRWQQMEDGANFFKTLLEADIPKIALENPVMMGHAKKIIGSDPTQTVQPWMFGHLENKATCLWLKNLPPLVETNNVKAEMLKLSYAERSKVHFAPDSKGRAKKRSMTPSGLALAMAEQWG